MSVEATAAAAAAAAVSAPAPEPLDGECTSMHHNDHQDSVFNNPDHGPESQHDAEVINEVADYNAPHTSSKSTGLHSPPDSNSAMKLDDSDDSSELSDVEDPTLEPDQENHLNGQTAAQENPQDEDIGEVTPSAWSGNVPIFTPTMRQFKDFKKYMEKIDCYGMKSGVVKIVPPQEWKDSLPALDDLVKRIRVREPIKQEIMGTSGTYRQVNILHQRSYNLPQWRQLCDQSEHQPPAKRGERRAQAPSKPKATPTLASSGSKRRGADEGAGTGTSTSTNGRLTRSRSKKTGAKTSAPESDDRPITPVSPRPSETIIDSVEDEIGDTIKDDDDPAPRAAGRMGAMRQAKPKEQSTSYRRKYARREGSAKIDEDAFRDFDYLMDVSDYTPERCEELERTYWRTLTYAPPLYGADVLGTLFDDSTESWNLNKLPNLLDVLGTKVPGVNTAYLYLGMWKSTFAWHLEDVDLYSINYLHFGAPKQWYSISQGDARRFEAAMKSIWPTDAKACDQFLRHKAFLISPNHLQQNFNIKVNKVVSYPGEFVVTYPYGYHSGYNLGYNCAEAVNFALDSWLPMGKIAKKCECAQAQDSVWVDVYEIERKLRGEETDYEETDEDEEDEDEDEDDELEIGIPTPPSTQAIKLKSAGRKRKRPVTDKAEKKVKKIRLRIKSQAEPPCCLCPHDVPGLELLPTDDNRKAHRLCALYGAETWIESVDGNDIVANVAHISKSRLDLKCLFCRSKRGICFQCSHKKCARSYHATCAAAAGVFVEEAEVPIFGEDGTEYKELAFEFNCRFHRTKRDRRLGGNVLEDCQKTRQAASALKKGDICQLQYHRGDIFAGIVIENRDSEQMLLVDILPNGDRVEVEWKWLLLSDPADLRLPHASKNAIPMPTSRKAKELINATRRRIEEPPRPEEPFVDGGFTWAEFNYCDLDTNKAQLPVDLSKQNQIWYYLGRFSTDARPQYTEDPQVKRHNVKSSFLDSIPRPALPPPLQRRSYGSPAALQNPGLALKPVPKAEKPYQYKPRDPLPPTYFSPNFTAYHFVPKSAQFEPKAPTGNTFFHAPAPIATPPNWSAAPQPVSYPPPPPPPPAPYYKFQHTPYVPPPPQTQRFHQAAPAPPAPPAPQAQPQYQIPQKPQYSTAHQFSHPSHHFPQQPTPQSSSCTDQTRHAVPEPQASAPQSTATFPPLAGPNVAWPPNTMQSPSVSRRPSLARSINTQHAGNHTRNRSSVSSHSGRFGLASGERFGTPPSSYGRARVDSMTKSPFSIGVTQTPGLGPSPSPQNNQLFQTQARNRSSSLISNLSLNTPMTSSAIRASSSNSAQALAGRLQSVIESNSSKEPRPNVVQKYAFFQVHHNRDSTKYRTPYAQWGGFTNGYEGSLRAHLMKTPGALLDLQRKPLAPGATNSPGISSLPPGQPTTSFPPPAGPPTPAMAQCLSPSAHRAPTVASATAHTTGLPLAPDFGTQSEPFVTPKSVVKDSSAWNGSSVGDANSADVNAGNGPPLHPAIRAHYAAMVQNWDVKAESQSDIGKQTQQPAVIPSVPLIPSGPSNSATPRASATPTPVLTSTPQSSRSASKNVKQSKSTTPIPPPLVPTPSTGSPAVAGSSVKTPSGPPKRTPIPAPRPWETLRKMQSPSAQPATSQSFSHAPATAGSMSTTPGLPALSSYIPIESTGYVPKWEVQTNRDVPYAGVQSQARSMITTPTRGTSAYPTPPLNTTGSLPLTTASLGGQTIPPSVSATMNLAPLNQTAGTPDLPEVSDGSMELVESIIRSAQKASGSFSGWGDGV